MLENRSSRSAISTTYCKQLFDSGILKGYFLAENNYYSSIYRILSELKDTINEYDYVSLTDLDMSLPEQKKNWLFDLTGILDNHERVGAVSVDFAPNMPASQGFQHVDPNVPTSIPGFWEIGTDGWFYTVRTSELLKFLELGGLGPGMHGYGEYVNRIGKIQGRVNLKFTHYGWLRTHPEWSPAYSETGVNFDINNVPHNNADYIGKQCQNFNEIKFIYSLFNP